jgi:DNA protecting protein DprA
MDLDTQDAIAFLGLSRVRGVGFHSLRNLGDLHGLGERLGSQVGDDVLAHILSEETGSPEERFRTVYQMGLQAYEVLQERGISLVACGDKDYPDALYDLGAKSRPVWFFYRGNVSLLRGRNVAVVGTRAPDGAGDFLTKYAVSTVAQGGHTIVSGLARGVDELAHEWALSTGVRNISVLGAGLMRVYPAKNTSLADRIVEAGGVLVSEYMPTAEPTKDSFVWRNRLQAALSRCVITPQWLASSGTAHTVRFARQMSRPVLNIELIGSELPPDHGVADESFEVPTDHERLATRLHQITSRDVESQARQFNLFGVSG